ncbi:thiamine pyrophosphate-dependent enzyme [Halobacillus sp. A5]|uniref:thiamine pyrophosphate-dependent enzyme n=1 Tax=Halobacillus sp. A5 TaxID=2880263 RepID=UPI0020A69ED2|nr:thiamine pyrophosphate-dependent enzyme [Halobacillus sp. A5]MCP3026399.1 thiamine pyrophosphate-dependent enzyme [Halobacillus sp. A5]
MTSAQAIVECIKLERINQVFCVPGESYLPVMDAIYDESSIELKSARHEGGASFMAEGFAKASGKPGVVLATRGVGGSNLSIGVHTAYQDSTPLVVFLGQVHSQFRGREGFQEIELEQFFGPITKWVVEIQHPERVPELVQRAFRIAKTGRPGPVVISLPEDLLMKKAEMVFTHSVNRPCPRPSLKEVHEVERRLRRAERPVVIAGGGVKAAEAEGVLLSFAEKYKIPVMSAFRRHDVFPNEHSKYTGHLGLGMKRQLVETVNKADVVLAVGSRLSEVTTQDYSLLTSGQSLIHIDIDYETLGKVYPPDVGIAADAKEALTCLLSMEVSPTWEVWAEERRAAYVQSLHVNNKTSHYEIISILQKCLPEDAIITNDAGNFAGWLHTYFQFNKKQTYVGPTSGAMGYGMPAAIGVKLARPECKVVSLSGDGGFMMTFQELETAVRYNIPVISVVFNNNMYGTIRMHQELQFPNKTIGTDLGVVPFSRLAREVGAVSYLVKKADEFEQALTQALKVEKPAVIEIDCDREQISVSSTIGQIRERTFGNS